MIDAAARDAIVDHRAERRFRIGHQRREALLHAVVIVRPAGAPGVERIDRRQARIQQRGELRRGLGG